MPEAAAISIQPRLQGWGKSEAFALSMKKLRHVWQHVYLFVRMTRAVCACMRVRVRVWRGTA